MGLHINVYKSNLGDCTNGGVSASNIEGLCISNVSGPFSPDDRYPEAKLVARNVMGRTIVNIVPVKEIENGSWTMFGGNYGATSDSRFSDKVEELMGTPFYGAVPIHDRVEG